MVAQHYRWDFVGLSTDEKPTPAISEKVVDGSTFYCADNSKLYVYCTDDWYERKPLGGGGGGDSNIPELTSADYNYDSGSGENDSIDTLTLESGVYLLQANTQIFLNDDEGTFSFEIPCLIEIDNSRLPRGKIVCFNSGSVVSYGINEDSVTHERTVISQENLRAYSFEQETFTFTLVDGTVVEKIIPTILEEG